MEKDKLFEYISHPEKLDAASLENLFEVVREYPYFQTARMLLVKNLKNIGHYRYDSELKLTATYVGDRTILYWLINDLSKLNLHLNTSIKTKIEEFGFLNREEPGFRNDETQHISYELPFFHSEYQIDIGQKKDFNLKDLLNDINENAKQSKNEEKKKEADRILDDFIVANPGKIEPGEHLSQEIDHSIEEIRESEGFLSEKLADIYAKQGHLRKAAGMYQKLADQIPERKEEFFNKIKELEAGENE